MSVSGSDTMVASRGAASATFLKKTYQSWSFAPRTSNSTTTRPSATSGPRTSCSSSDVASHATVLLNAARAPRSLLMVSPEGRVR